ncbi:hypothetical protein LTR62_004517 [Meristemomyces frigidus]|uniref:RCC1/BLIP-II protein n=1 Tax=Meristemomyces frigidus TaxID=1508187 RepID=A0AAN7TH79_9PEZI|nr:hypothetical protein LTR62_004517 [Meristemomyces frigidus]
MSLKKNNILSAGLNNVNQLDSSSTKQLRTFTPLGLSEKEEEEARILFAGWSTTVLATTNRIISQGFQNIQDHHATEAEDEATRLPSLDSATANLHSAIGNQNGLLALLTTAGNLVLVSPSPTYNQIVHLVPQPTDSGPRLSHLALATNDHVVLAFKQAPKGNLCHILEFETFDAFTRWHNDPSGGEDVQEGGTKMRHYMLPGRPKQVVANAATFLLLMEGGEVYSWGDARYRSLGRVVVDSDGSSTAETPKLIEALGGVKVERVAGGGWLSGAVSADGAGYLWGSSGTSATDAGMKCLNGIGSGEVALIEILGDDGEAMDVVDLAVGSAHLAIVVKDARARHRLFVVGNNEDGQLGLGSDVAFVEDWTEVHQLHGQHISQLVCGPRSTYTATTTP